MNAKNLVFPTVHLNGTSKQALLDQLSAAMIAVHNAGRALAQATPHARDYYVQGSEQIFAALDQHGARLRKLTEIADELQTIADAILDQKGPGEK